MTISELQSRLKEEGVNENIYAFQNAPEVDDCHVIIQENNGWHVFYKERGQRNDEVVLPDEASACEEILQRVLRYPTNRIPLTWPEMIWNYLTNRRRSSRHGENNS